MLITLPCSFTPLASLKTSFKPIKWILQHVSEMQARKYAQFHCNHRGHLLSHFIKPYLVVCGTSQTTNLLESLS